ncbi:hypothetical protein FG385_09670 [Amycolatopsis alkalitolerans]|uniref:Uncharacterized protein n=1 Tax=Amycolatopsis alkalitolerans TaxID=2547244 RepID=A0A5C4M768_9PSEU|nr:hypothetical protein FG385_09670 [Amycolatopsis alkalitolerans]
MRGGLLALCSAALAITAHALADGGMPDTALTVVLTVLIGWIGAALAEKTSGLLGVLTVLGVAQVAMHLLLCVVMGHMAMPGPGMYLTHAVATACTAALFSHAESMMGIAVARLWLLLPIVWHAAPVAGAPILAPAAPDIPALPVLLNLAHRRRGPPVCS